MDPFPLSLGWGANSVPEAQQGVSTPGGGHPTHIYISDSLLLWVFPPMVPWAQETHSKGPSCSSRPHPGGQSWPAGSGMET